MSEFDGTPTETDQTEADPDDYWTTHRVQAFIDHAIILMALQVLERVVSAKPNPFKKGSKARYHPTIRSALHARILHLIERYDQRTKETETDT